MRIYLCVLWAIRASGHNVHIAVDAQGALQLARDASPREPLLRRNGGSNETRSEVMLEENLAPPRTGNQSGHETPESLRAAEKERHAMSTLTYVWFPMAVVLALLFEVLHWPWAEVDWNLPMERSDGREGSEKVDSSFLGLTLLLASRAWSLARIYLAGAGRVKGRCYLLVLVWIHILGMYLDLITFDFQQRYWNLYQQPSLPLFFELIRNWFILHFTRMITYVYEFYVEDMFFLHCRDHLTRYFEAIWVPNTYVFRMREGGKFDNPDQRIHVDVANFVTQTYSLSFGVTKMIVNMLMYSYMLMSITPASMHAGTLVSIAFLYSAVGSAAMHFLGAQLAHFSWQGERCAGDFRSELRRVYDQSETVASLRSEGAELQRLKHRFEKIKLNTWQSMLLEKRLAILQKWYSPLREVLFMCILAPFFIRGEVSLGRLKQSESALDKISDSLSFLVDNYSRLSVYRATVDRLHNFRHSCLTYLHQEKSSRQAQDTQLIQTLALLGLPPGWPKRLGGADAPPAPAALPASAASGGPLQLEAALLLPSGELLIDVQLEVPAGACVLLCGKEGAGKSTILKAMAGMWPFLRNTRAPPSNDMVLIPQKPRLPMPLTLREAVSFPQSSTKWSEEEIRAVLDRVGLSDFAQNGLDVQLDVNSSLSGGEFQKLMVAHCLLQKPAWVLLDESMAHMSSANRVKMYQLLTDELVAHGSGLISTSHSWQELVSFHGHFYRIETSRTDGTQMHRELQTFDPKEALGEDELALRVKDKDAEIARLRQELVQLQRDRRNSERAN
ncbi:unnamed protein product [Effrenium voratum]|uniref:ABC transporter domain-containing protein n=1 Tax=Effrenium voratum TaxID=2562239 RepID=A0AA36ISV8_9DINO|nr:unnamed protein product [Effrenium voratum]CAJ1437870.1 unnamed protein product [Effrenium voratum]